eukprot:scaffold17368_cov58-Skeletonema_marinoi.AAC.1
MELARFGSNPVYGIGGTSGSPDSALLHLSGAPRAENLLRRLRPILQKSPINKNCFINMTKSTPVDTAYNTHDPLTTGEGSTVISQRNSEHGALYEHDKILFRMVKKEDAPRGPSFTADLHGMTILPNRE